MAEGRGGGDCKLTAYVPRPRRHHRCRSGRQPANASTAAAEGGTVQAQGGVSATLNTAVKPLWLPMRVRNCTATCSAVGLAAINAGSEGATLCAAALDNYWYEG